MSHYIAERANAESTTIKLYTVRGDQRTKRARHTIELVSGETIEQRLADLGLEMVGRWITTTLVGSNQPNTETVNVFPRA